MHLTTFPAPLHATRIVAVALFLVLSALSGCGLAMDNEDRLARGEQALADGDDRAAIIDAKDVLLDEPDNVRGRLLLGRASVAAGDGASAEKELHRAIQLGTPPAEVAGELAQALVMQGKYQQVLDEISMDGLDDATAVVVLVARGNALMGVGEPEAARDAYTAALELSPDDFDAQLGIASSFVAERNFVQARGVIDHLLEAYADNPRAWLFSGAFRMQLRDFESAESNFSVALDLATGMQDGPMRMQALNGLAESLLEQQKVDAARDVVDQLSAAAPESPQALLLTSRIAYIDGNWKLAQQNLQRVLAVAPDYRPAQMLLGAVHFQSGNLAQAEMYLAAAVAADPNDRRARQMLAETRLQMRNADAAQEALAPILSGPTADPLSLQIAAQASLGRSEYDQAIAYLEQSIAADPGNIDLQFQLVATLLQIGRAEEAQAVLDGITLSDSPDDAYRHDTLAVLTMVRNDQVTDALDAALLVAEEHADRAAAFDLLGITQLANADINGARGSFETAARLDPADLTALRYLALIDEQQGNWPAAKARYEAILAQSPGAAWAKFALGKGAYRDGEFEQSAQWFSEALESAPENAEYRLNLARAERRLGNPDDAAETLESGEDDVFSDFSAAVLLGTIKAESGDIAGALEIAAELQRRYPTNPAAFAFEGEVYQISGDLEKADSAYAKALALGPMKSHAIRAYRIKRRLGAPNPERPLEEYLAVRPLDNDVRVILAESYMQNDNLDESVAMYEQVAARDANNAVVLNNLAWTYFMAGDPRAIETARKAHELAPENGAILDTLGWLLVESGSLEEGETLLRQALELEDGRAEVRYHHAAALAKLGRTDEARSTLESLVAGDEEFASRKSAEELLAEL